MEESQSAGKQQRALSCLGYKLFLFFFAFDCLPVPFILSLSLPIQEPNTQKSLHNTVEKNVSRARKV
jgi:hypothetical protein